MPTCNAMQILKEFPTESKIYFHILFAEHYGTKRLLTDWSEIDRNSLIYLLLDF